MTEATISTVGQGRRARWIRIALMVLVVAVSLTGLGLVIASFWRPFYGSLALESDYRGHLFLSDGRATICIEEEGGQSLAEMIFGRDLVSGIRYLHRAKLQETEMRVQDEKFRQEIVKQFGFLPREFRDIEIIASATNKRARDQLFATLYQLAAAQSSNLPKGHGYAGLVFKYDSDSEERLVLSLPTWFLLVFFLIAPGFLTFRIVRRRRRYSIMGCKHCGYDLTGNMSGRCPECGTVIPDSRDSKSLATFARPPGGAAAASDGLRSNR